MEIFGLDPIIVIVAITVTGVILQNVFGWLKNGPESFDPRQAAASAMIAVFTGIAFVGTAISNLPENVPDVELFLILAGLAATVAGFDILAKNGVKAAMQGIATARKA